MIKRVKQFMHSRAMLSKIGSANDYQVIKPFLLGCQIEYRRFGDYVFVKNTVPNEKILTDRHFSDFKKSVEAHVNWELTDSIVDFSETILYNEKYNIMILMVNDKLWNTLNTAINIAQNTDKDISTQRDIVISAFNTLKV